MYEKKSYNFYGGIPYSRKYCGHFIFGGRAINKASSNLALVSCNNDIIGMCHVCMRYEIKVINVGGFNIDDLEPDRQSAKFNSTPNFPAIRYSRRYKRRRPNRGWTCN